MIAQVLPSQAHPAQMAFEDSFVDNIIAQVDDMVDIEAQKLPAWGDNPKAARAEARFEILSTLIFLISNRMPEVELLLLRHDD